MRQDRAGSVLQAAPHAVIQRLGKLFICTAQDARLRVDKALAVFGPLVGERRGVFVAG